MKEVATNKWKYIEKDGNPTEAGVYLVTLIYPEWKDGKKTGRRFAETDFRYLANLDERPDVKSWALDGQPEHGLAWLEQCGSYSGEQVYAWMLAPKIADLPEGVLLEE